MNQPRRLEVSDAQTDPSVDVQAMIEALQRDGVDRFDPVRFHYIEVLARRAGAQRDSVQRILVKKLAQAVQALNQRHAHAQRDAARSVATPEVNGRRPTLGDLVRHVAQQAPDKADGRSGASTAPRTELKSVRYFRNTWSRLSAEKQVARALDRAPKNAGPINSHLVALRSLALMRDASPDYLHRFLSYVETLQRLDQSEQPAKIGRVRASHSPRRES